MAKIYGGIDDVKAPEFDPELGFKEHQKLEDQYIEDVRESLKAGKPGDKYVGEIVQFQVADGYALYMVASMKPLELVHLHVGDAWQFQYVHRLTIKDIKQQIDRSKKLDSIFAKR